MGGTKMKKQREQDETQLVPQSEETEGLTLDPGCNDEAVQITMLSEAGRRNAIKAGSQVNWRTGTIRRQP